MHGSAAHVSFIDVTNTGDYLAWAWRCTSSFLTWLDARRSWARLDRVIDKLARHHEEIGSDQQGSSCFFVRRRQGPMIHRSKSSRRNMLPKDAYRGKRVAVVDVMKKIPIWFAWSPHTPYLARHCRRDMVGSPPRGISTMVDWSVEVHAIRSQMVTETQAQDLYRFRPSAWCKTLRPVLCYFVLIWDEIWSSV
jgi:hypothetical protein